MIKVYEKTGYVNVKKGGFKYLLPNDLGKKYSYKSEQRFSDGKTCRKIRIVMYECEKPYKIKTETEFNINYFNS